MGTGGEEHSRNVLASLVIVHLDGQLTLTLSPSLPELPGDF